MSKKQIVKFDNRSAIKLQEEQNIMKLSSHLERQTAVQENRFVLQGR